VYLAALEATVQQFEVEGAAFAAEMARAPIERPDQLAWLGQQSLSAKTREAAINAVFEPAIRKPRLYLDRVYALRRRVIDGFTTGGATAARRYAERQRELQEVDRRARMEADRQTRAAQAEADAMAVATRRRLSEAAAAAAAAGDAAQVQDLLAEARAVEPPTVEPMAPPPSQADAGAVAGITSRSDWTGAIVDLRLALMAMVAPMVIRDMADAIEQGDLTNGGISVTTTMIAGNLRMRALQMPVIPIDLVQGNPTTLQARARADRDSVDWPGFAFAEKTIPIRRPKGGR
jgi:hypothetical protein